MAKNRHIVILGAGPCGLAAAWALTENGFSNVTVLEKEPELGGMVRSKMINANPYECGAHYFHADEKELLDKVLTLLKGEVCANKRNLVIKFNGRYFQYPLQLSDLIRGFNPLELFLLFSSMAYSMAGNRLFPKPLVTAEDVLVAKYGRRLYKKFFEGYIVNFWAMHPSKLSAKFALRRIPRLDAMELLRKALSFLRIAGAGNKHDEFIEVVNGCLYYPHRGMGRIWEGIGAAITRRGGRIIREAEICGIGSQNMGADKYAVKEISFRRDGRQETLRADTLISTIPLPSLFEYLSFSGCKAPADVQRLNYRSLIVVGMLVDKEKVLPSYCTYFRDRVFSRLSEPKLAGLKVNPSDATVLLAEISCDFQDGSWNNPAGLIEAVYRDLEEEGLLARREIIETHILKERFAYPVFDLEYEKAITEAKRYLCNFLNLYSTGRQGIFAYVNSHKVIKMGFEVAGLAAENKIKETGSSSSYY